MKLGSQVPNSYLSVAVNQMVSGRCPKDIFHLSIDRPDFDFQNFIGSLGAFQDIIGH